MEEDGSQHRGDSPTLFEKRVSSLESLGLVKAERLGQRLNVPTQGRRVAQTGTKPFSLMAPGSDPQPGIEPGPHWWETDVLTTRPPEHPQVHKYAFIFPCICTLTCLFDTSSNSNKLGLFFCASTADNQRCSFGCPSTLGAHPFLAAVVLQDSFIGKRELHGLVAAFASHVRVHQGRVVCRRATVSVSAFFRLNAHLILGN